MRFTVITPTIQRQSLVKTCQSLDTQTFSDWEHLVMIDRPANDDLIFSLAHLQRYFYECEKAHNNGGNTCRHNAWDHAQGEYLIYLDDDNYFMDDGILAEIDAHLTGQPAAFFPILRFGWRFFPSGVPRSCHVDTANVVTRRDVAQWPDTTAYSSDGIFIENLVAKYPYSMFPDVRPIICVPVQGKCQ